MKRYFVCGDVHGFYNIWMNSLKEAGFDINDPNHILVSLGDLIDRGENPEECLKFVNSLPKERKLLICGNHEDLLCKCISRGEARSHDISNGTFQTICDLGSHGDFKDVFKNAENNKNLIQYIESLIDYYETDKYIFVHGWIPCDVSGNHYSMIFNKYSFDPDWRNGNWQDARWYNGMDAWNQEVRVEGKTICCGHWHTSWGHAHLHNYGEEWPNLRSTNPEHRIAHFSPFKDEGILAIDACTAFSHKINIEILDE